MAQLNRSSAKHIKWLVHPVKTRASSEDSDRLALPHSLISLRCLLEETLSFGYQKSAKTQTLIRLHRHKCWSDSSLDANDFVGFAKLPYRYYHTACRKAHKPTHLLLGRNIEPSINTDPDSRMYQQVLSSLWLKTESKPWSTYNSSWKLQLSTEWVLLS